MEQVVVDNPPLKDRECKSRCVSILSDLKDVGLFLLDVLLDVKWMVSLYQKEAYVFMGLLVFILLGSSILVNAFSLLWYLADKDGTQTRRENHLKNLCSLKIFHVFQMGLCLRYASVLRISICGFCCEKLYTKDEVRTLKHDLCILRLMETFSESGPQLVLMLTFLLHTGQMDLIELLKALISALAISVSVTTYHSAMRSFLPEKDKQGSSPVYFLWNLLLIGHRVAAVALFASVFPYYIAAHFLCSWAVLFFCAWRCKTNLMNSAGEEWFYQATVGLIWYFNWFNMVKDRNRWKSIIYHTWIGLDIGILCGVWVWQMKKHPPYFDLPLDPYVIVVVMMSLYIAGLCLRGIFMCCCRQTETVVRLEDTENEVTSGFRCVGLDPSHSLGQVKGHDRPPGEVIRVSNRMRILAENFYS